MKPLILLSILGLCALATKAQTPPVILTLDQCRQEAVDNNAKVKMAEGSVKEAQELSRYAFTKYFPTVDANWLGYRSNKGAIQYTLPNLGEFIPDLNFPLGTIELIKKGWSGSITALQPVFAGGQILNSNKLAHVGEEAANLEKRNAVEEVLLTAEQYYWQIVTLKSKKSTLTQVMTMVDTLEYQVQVAVDAGVVLRNELLKVQLRRNELRSLMVDLDNGINLSCNLLAQYIGREGEAIDVDDSEVSFDLPPYPTNMFMDASSALSGTADYQLLEAQVKAASLKTKLAVGENLPTVGVGAGWVYDELFSQKHNFVAVMLTVNVPITAWWGGSHKIKQNKIAEENARTQMTDLSQMLEIGMQNSWDDLTAAYRKMEIQHESIEQSTENLRLNENYYKYGVSNVTDLLDAQSLYRQALDQYSEAYGAFRLAQAKYLKATGRLTLL